MADDGKSRYEYTRDDVCGDLAMGSRLTYHEAVSVRCGTPRPIGVSPAVREALKDGLPMPTPEQWRRICEGIRDATPTVDDLRRARKGGWRP